MCPVFLLADGMLSLDDICALAGVPPADHCFATVNGIPWACGPRAFSFGDVIQVRPRRSQLVSFTLDSARREIRFLEALAFPVFGPCMHVGHIATQSLPADVYRHHTRETLLRHFCRLYDNLVTEILLPPGARIAFLAVDLPIIRISSGQDACPSESVAQAIFDSVFARRFGHRQVRALNRQLAGAWLFSAATEVQPTVWVYAANDGLGLAVRDTFGAGLEHCPLMEGTRLVPVISYGHVGIAVHDVAQRPPTVLQQVRLPSTEGTSLLQLRAEVVRSKPLPHVSGGALPLPTPCRNLTRIRTSCTTVTAAADRTAVASQLNASTDPFSPEASRQICLSESLPTPADELDKLESAVRGIRVPWLDFLCSAFPPPQALHPVTRYAMQQAPALCPASLHELHIFVDGSYFPFTCQAGWSVVVVACQFVPAGLAYTPVGYACGNFRSIQCLPGASDPNNFKAELFALGIASAFIGTLPPWVPVNLWGDCQPALQVAQGIAASSESSGTFCTRVRSLVQTAQQSRAWSWHWLPSHSANPWNEAADSIAKLAGLHRLPPSPLPSALLALVSSPLHGWAWRVDAADGTLPSLRQLHHGVYECPDAVPPHVAESLTSPDPEQPTQRLLRANFLLLNVQTSRDKLPALQQQLLDRQMLVSAFLETRQKTACQTTSGPFYRFDSAACNGDGGCSLIFNLGLPVFAGDRTCLDRRRLTCVFASSQVLAVTAEIARTTWLFICAHAPHSGKPKAAIDAWWDHFDCLPFLAQYAERIILFIDANARVGSVQSDSIGSHAADPEDHAGSRLRQWCDKHQVFIPSTFQDHRGNLDPEARDPTWISPAGHPSRIDYIGVPTPWKPAAVAHQVLKDFETLCSSQDHFAVCTAVQLPLAAGCLGPSTGLKRFPTAAEFLGPEARALIDCGMRMMLPVPWSVDIHSHTQYVYDHARVSITAIPAPSRHFRCFVSDLSAQYLGYLRHLKQSLRTLGRLARRLRAQPDATSREGWSAAECDVIKHGTVQILRATRRLLRMTLRADKAAFAEKQIAALVSAGQIGDSKAVFQALRPLRHRCRKVVKPYGPLQVLSTADGRVLSDYSQVQEAKADFFGAIEAGVRVDIDGVLERFHSRQVQPRTGSGHFSLRDLPTLSCLEQLICRSKGNKAPGPCGLPEWIWKRYPPASAQAFHSIALKGHLRLAEPIHWKLTNLVTLFKGKGSANQLSGYRGICLLDGAGKINRRLLRPTLAHALEAGCPSVLGTLHGNLVAVSQHEIRSYARIAAQQRWPNGTLFVDATAAYYRVLRESLFCPVNDDQELCSILRALGVSPELFHEVLRWAEDSALLGAVSPHAQRVIRSFMVASFFRVEGSCGYTLTRAGSRPGDALADLLFAFIMQDMLAEVRTLLADSVDPVCELAEIDGPVQSTWADDLALPFSARCCGSLLELAARTSAAVHQAMVRRAMAPNYSRGKTELLLSLRGPRAREVRRQLFITQLGTLPFSFGRHSFQVHCVHSYSHLGGIMHASGRCLPDIVQKAAVSLSSVRPLAGPALRNPCLPWKRRVQILHSLGVSRLLPSAATWYPMSNAEARVFARAVVSLYRLLTTDDRHTGQPALPGEKEVTQYCGLPTAAVLLAHVRVRHLARALFASDRLASLLFAERSGDDSSWLSMCLQDVRLLQSMRLLPPDAHESFPHRLLDIAAFEPRLFARACRGAATHAGGPLAPPPVPCISTGVAAFACDLCPALFESKQQLSVHKFRVHGTRVNAAPYARSTVCRICLKQFWHPKRLLRHLEYDKPDCLEALVAHDLDSPPQTLAADLPCSTRRELPAVRLSGPIRPLYSCDVPAALDLAVDWLADSASLAPADRRESWQLFCQSLPCTPAITDALQCFADAWG